MDQLDQNMTRYLLGELSEEEQAVLEEKYFRDPEVFNEVLQVESELVDAYARGELSTEMRERFEQSYLKHPARRKRVEFARALTTKIDEREASRRSTLQVPWQQRLLAAIGGNRPVLRFATVLVIVLIALAVVWIFVNRRQQGRIQAQRENQKQQEQPAVTPNEKLQERVAQVPSETPQSSPSPNINPAPSIASLVLSVGAVRGPGSTQTLTIPHDTPQAQIVLNLKDDSYPRYRVSLQKIGGAEIFTQTNIRPHGTKAGARFVFTIPARQFTSGEYNLILSGITPEGEVDNLSKSLFRVENK
jgi:anti-sigma factor RsiW